MGKFYYKAMDGMLYVFWLSVDCPCRYFCRRSIILLSKCRVSQSSCRATVLLVDFPVSRKIVGRLTSKNN